jgi:hypothetical protein
VRSLPSALEVRAPSGRFVIEMTPVRAGEGTESDIVAFGAVGTPPGGTLADLPLRGQAMA